MGFVKEFREFAVKGNAIDMAVGIVIGAAFGRVVSSLVEDVITPPLGYVIGGVDFAELAVVLPALREGAEDVTVRYGAFLQSAFDFLIVALTIFLVVKAINRMKRKEEVAPTVPLPPSKEQLLLEEIRDVLKERR